MNSCEIKEQLVIINQRLDELFDLVNPNGYKTFAEFTKAYRVGAARFRRLVSEGEIEQLGQGNKKLYRWKPLKE